MGQDPVIEELNRTPHRGDYVWYVKGEPSMPDDGFCDLALTPESLETHRKVYLSIPEYVSDPEFRRLVDSTFEIEARLLQKGLAPEIEQALWDQWEMCGIELRRYNLAGSDTDSPTLDH